MGFTYIRKCTMACWTGGEKQGMGVKSILAFLLRLGHALHWSGEGNIFLTETDTAEVCLGTVKYVLWHKLKRKKASLFYLENEEDAHRAGERGWGRRFPVEGQRWGVVYGGRWLSCRDQLALQSKDNKWKPHSTLAAGGVVSDFRKVKEGDGHWSRWNLFMIWTLEINCLLFSSICWYKPDIQQEYIF